MPYWRNIVGDIRDVVFSCCGRAQEVYFNTEEGVVPVVDDVMLLNNVVCDYCGKPDFFTVLPRDNPNAYTEYCAVRQKVNQICAEWVKRIENKGK